jgi:hypothetical protein
MSTIEVYNRGPGFARDEMPLNETEGRSPSYQIYKANTTIEYRKSYKEKYYSKKFYLEQPLFVNDLLWNDEIRMLHWISTIRQIHPNLLEIKNELEKNVMEKQKKLLIIVKSIKELFKKKRAKLQDALVKMVILYKTDREIL